MTCLPGSLHIRQLGSPQNENLNLLDQIKCMNLSLYSSKIKTEKLTDPSKALLVLGQRPGAHQEELGRGHKNSCSDQH